MTPEHKKTLALHQRTRDAIDALVRKWKGELWLGQWKIDTVIEWNGIAAPDAGTTRYGECSCDWRYLEASIRFNVPACSTLSKSDLERTVIHELLHIHMNEMRESGLPHEERVVSNLTNVIDYLANKRMP